MKRDKQEGPRYRGPSCLRPCCTFTPANRCKISPALTNDLKRCEGYNSGYTGCGRRIAPVGNDARSLPSLHMRGKVLIRANVQAAFIGMQAGLVLSENPIRSKLAL